MFESGKNTVKTKKKDVVPCEIQLPTPEDLFKIWYADFETLLKVSEEFNEEKFKDFNENPLKYIRDLRE